MLANDIEETSEVSLVHEAVILKVATDALEPAPYVVHRVVVETQRLDSAFAFRGSFGSEVDFLTDNLGTLTRFLSLYATCDDDHFIAIFDQSFSPLLFLNKKNDIRTSFTINNRLFTA